ncbi:unnamed protein product [Nippostrongylus brasiliensis]|uniref:Uncharacterized protein n=1 Tax=Nippostrongylus brasiliensis TaxID=27835 RepID=A0A0N4XRS7_NIPBR|nr:unnamed protein product [Nippostrongylus brasiliensis]
MVAGKNILVKEEDDAHHLKLVSIELIVTITDVCHAPPQPVSFADRIAE